LWSGCGVTTPHPLHTIVTSVEWVWCIVDVVWSHHTHSTLVIIVWSGCGVVVEWAWCGQACGEELALTGHHITMFSTHSYLHNLLHHRDTTSDIAQTLYSCPHTPHACQTPTSSYECCIKTNIRRTTLELMQRVQCCELLACVLTNKRRLID